MVKWQILRDWTCIWTLLANPLSNIASAAPLTVAGVSPRDRCPSPVILTSRGHRGGEGRPVLVELDAVASVTGRYNGAVIPPHLDIYCLGLYGGCVPRQGPLP